MRPVDKSVDNVGKTPKTMGISLGISCEVNPMPPVDMPVYQALFSPLAVGKKFLSNFFNSRQFDHLELASKPFEGAAQISHRLLAQQR